MAVSEEGDSVVEEASILNGANYLLRRVGINAAPIVDFEELADSASSFFVAIFEAMFHTRLSTVMRKPTHAAHFVGNAQVVIDVVKTHITQVLQSVQGDLGHITGESVHEGDVIAITHLIRIFLQIDRFEQRELNRAEAEDGGGEGAEEGGSQDEEEDKEEQEADIVSLCVLLE